MTGINRDKHVLFGIELKPETHNTYYYRSQPSVHTFYFPIYSLKTGIWVHIWSVSHCDTSVTSYFFSAFHNGNHIIPDRDSRFKNPMSKWFPKWKPWTECGFNSMGQLINFLQRCEI